MAEKHPYAPGPGGIAAAITQFRKSFPNNVDADTLRKLGIAPKNESYVINVLRFIGAIDAEGNKTSKATSVFSKHADEEFAKAFEEMVREAYSDLFSLHTDASWNLSSDKLIAFFRSSDQTTDLVGQRQAATFQLLARFAGHGEAPAVKVPSPTKVGAKQKPKAKPEEPASKPPVPAGNGTSGGIGLTVRIEVNLPAGGDQETYDRIFRSIRENLLNAK